MNFDYAEYRVTRNMLPIPLENKEKYFHDIFNIENSWTGKVDALMANTFFHEASQLIVNAIALFEMGYFDSAFYSLRQSLELSTTIIFLTDRTDSDGEKLLADWKKQDRFPMQKPMLDFLIKNTTVFADIREKLVTYFDDLEKVKHNLNKYVHKQGYKTFYVSRNHMLAQNDKDVFKDEFEQYLKKCIGSIAIFRLAIDPMPIVLADPDVYRRSGDMMTEPYSDEFIDEYIGADNLAIYKTTDLYKDFYAYFMAQELQHEAVNNLIKYQHIDKREIEKILEQKHLLSPQDITAVLIANLSNKIALVHAEGLLGWYFTDTKTARLSQGYDSSIYPKYRANPDKYNMQYDEAFISCIKIGKETFCIEHNSPFSSQEILKIEDLEKSLIIE